jgi:hypothetical protein
MKIGFLIMKFTLILSSLTSKSHVRFGISYITGSNWTKPELNIHYEFLLKAHFAFLQIIQNVCTTFFYQVSDTDFRWTCIECLKNTTNVIRHTMNKVKTNRTSFLCINHNGHHNTEQRT